MSSTTIIEFTSTFIAADIFKNYFFMVRRMCVQPPLLVRSATVSVLCRNPAVNRQPGFRRELVEQSTTRKSLFSEFPSSVAIEIEESKAVKIS